MKSTLPILLACLMCAMARAESPVRTLVVGDVVVAEGIDWIAWDAPPESVELLQGVVIDGMQASPYRASGTVVLRLSKPTKIKLWSGADDPANPARTIVEWSPQLEPSRLDELVGRIAAIESRLEQLAAGSLPQPPPPEEEPLRVDPNTASIEELQRLPGIGPALAQRIIDAREHVVFREPMDLAVVKGIGAATVEKIAEFLTFEGAEEADEQPAEGAEQTMSTPFADAIVAVGTNSTPGDLILRWYKGHETDGTTAIDSSPNGVNGTYTGATINQPPLSKDDGARSVMYGGISDMMDAPGTLVVGDNPPPKSLAIIFRTSTSDGYLFGSGRTSAPDGHYWLSIEDGKLVGGRIPHQGTQHTITSVKEVDDGAVHLAVLVVASPSDLRLYLDGALVGQNTGESVGFYFSSAWTTRIGRQIRVGVDGVGSSSWYSGYTEHAVVFNKALTDEDVELLWAALQGEPEPSTSRDIFRGRHFTARHFTARHLRSGY